MKNSNHISSQDLAKKEKEVAMLKMELEALELREAIASLTPEHKLNEVDNFDIELDLSDLENSEDFFEQLFKKSTAPKTREEAIEDFLDKVEFGFDLYDSKALAQDAEENEFDPYDEDYYYFVLDDPYQMNDGYTVLSRNDYDLPALDTLFASSEDELWQIIEGKEEYLFTEEEIMISHPYLWDIREPA